jgi:hypothetical protein
MVVIKPSLRNEELCLAAFAFWVGRSGDALRIVTGKMWWQRELRHLLRLGVLVFEGVRLELEVLLMVLRLLERLLKFENWGGPGRKLNPWPSLYPHGRKHKPAEIGAGALRII